MVLWEVRVAGDAITLVSVDDPRRGRREACEEQMATKQWRVAEMVAAACLLHGPTTASSRARKTITDLQNLLDLMDPIDRRIRLECR